MKKLSKLGSCIIIGCLSVSSLAMANSSADPSQHWNRHTGAYAGANAGTGLAYVADVTDDSAPRLNSAYMGLTGAASVGHNFTPIFALEGGLMFLAARNNFDSNNKTITYTIPYVTTRYVIPLASRWAINLKAGLMHHIDDLERSKFLLFTGAGVSYSITQHLDIDAHYQGAVYGTIGAGQAAVGLTYHLDRSFLALMPIF